MVQTEAWCLKDARAGGETRVLELVKETHGEQNPALECV